LVVVEVSSGRIQTIYAVLNPDELRRVGTSSTRSAELHEQATAEGG
jgi:hypothetical protein